MAAQGYNDEGAGEKLKKIYELVAAENPDNLADDNLGGRFTGYSDEQILNHMNDKAYIGAAFSESERLKEVLKKIKETDLGISVVITGNYQEVFKILKEVGIKPHTVNMSLGVFGQKELMPEGKVLAVASMCGHGMVTRTRIENMIEKVKKGSCSANQGGEQLASTCTCGIFNPVLAGKILKK
jgi:hypothetical protein